MNNQELKKEKGEKEEKVLVFSCVDGRLTGDHLEYDIITREEFEFLEETKPLFYFHKGDYEIEVPWRDDEHKHYQMCAKYETNPERIKEFILTYEKLETFFPESSRFNLNGGSLSDHLEVVLDEFEKWCERKGYNI